MVLLLCCCKVVPSDSRERGGCAAAPPEPFRMERFGACDKCTRMSVAEGEPEPADTREGPLPLLPALPRGGGGSPLAAHSRLGRSFGSDPMFVPCRLSVCSADSTASGMKPEPCPKAAPPPTGAPLQLCAL